MHRFRLAEFFIIIFVFTFTLGAMQNDNPLLVGVAKINITPDDPIRMTPYKRQELSQGVHDSLYTKVLLFEVGKERMAIVSCDLVGYLNQNISAIAKKQFGIRNLMLCSTHTHSSPDLSSSKKYSRQVEAYTIQALKQAMETRFPARIAAGYRSFPQLGYMRLIMRKDGRAHAPWYRKDERIPPHNPDRIPFGPVDPEVGVIKVEDKDGQIRAVLINYACHATANGRNYQLSADYPGMTTAKVEEAMAKETIAMFVNGGSGNIAPLFRSKHSRPDGNPPTDYSQIEKMGTLLADQVLTLCKNIAPPVDDNASLVVMKDSLAFRGRFDNSLNYSLHFTTAVINDRISIATFPGEPFVRFQLFWKKQAEVQYPFFFGYTFVGGDNPHYVPDIRSAAYGGYGADADARLIEVGAGERLMNKHLENFYRLRKIMRDTPGTP